MSNFSIPSSAGTPTRSSLGSLGAGAGGASARPRRNASKKETRSAWTNAAGIADEQLVDGDPRLVLRVAPMHADTTRYEGDRETLSARELLMSIFRDALLGLEARNAEEQEATHYAYLGFDGVVVAASAVKSLIHPEMPRALHILKLIVVRESNRKLGWASVLVSALARNKLMKVESARILVVAYRMDDDERPSTIMWNKLVAKHGTFAPQLSAGIVGDVEREMFKDCASVYIDTSKVSGRDVHAAAAASVSRHEKRVAQGVEQLGARSAPKGAGVGAIRDQDERGRKRAIESRATSTTKRASGHVRGDGGAGGGSRRGGGARRASENRDPREGFAPTSTPAPAPSGSSFGLERGQKRSTSDARNLATKRKRPKARDGVSGDSGRGVFFVGDASERGLQRDTPENWEAQESDGRRSTPAWVDGTED